MSSTFIDLCIKGLAGLVGVISVAFAAVTYAKNTRTKAAEFLVSLHKAFFVDAGYQEMKTLLDCEDAEGQKKLEKVAREESAPFTDFLNFFELVAYLTEIETLAPEDTEALLGYYLNKLVESPAVWGYIRQSSNGFENLRRLLAERAAR